MMKRVVSYKQEKKEGIDLLDIAKFFNDEFGGTIS